MITGTKVQVWHGTADRTPDGLTRADLMRNKRGKVVSKVKHDAAEAIHPNGPPPAERRECGFFQFLAPIVGSLLGSIRPHIATAASHLNAAMRSGRVTGEQVRRAAAAVTDRGAGLLSLLGIKTPLADIPIIGSILG